MMNKILLDIGGHKGESILHGKDYVGEDFPNWTCKCYEPIKMQFKANYPNVELINKLAWIHDGTHRLYIDASKKCLGSSTIPSKVTGKITNDNYLDLPCIDMATVINSLDGIIVVKCNIEISEYILLPHLLDKGCFDKIHELYVAFHWWKTSEKEKYKAIHDEVVGRLKGHKVNYKILPDPVRHGLNQYRVAK